MFFYSLIFNRLHNLHPYLYPYWNSLLYSFISSWEKSAFVHFAAAIASHYNLAFLFHRVPITAGWTEVAWYERLARHLHVAGSVTRRFSLTMKLLPDNSLCSQIKTLSLQSIKFAWALWFTISVPCLYWACHPCRWILLPICNRHRSWNSPVYVRPTSCSNYPHWRSSRHG